MYWHWPISSRNHGKKTFSFLCDYQIKMMQSRKVIFWSFLNVAYKLKKCHISEFYHYFHFGQGGCWWENNFRQIQWKEFKQKFFNINSHKYSNHHLNTKLLFYSPKMIQSLAWRKAYLRARSNVAYQWVRIWSTEIFENKQLPVIIWCIVTCV